VEKVVNNLRNLDVTKAHGPDGLHPRLLKDCSEQVEPSLCALFNHSLNRGRVPIEWKGKVLTVTRKSNPLCFYYHLEDTTLAHVRKEKDLGCIVTNHLTWDQYVLT
jgi:hypothetical protein